MRRAAIGASVVMVMVVLFLSVPARGQAGGPVMDYLQNVIKPTLDSILASLNSRQACPCPPKVVVARMQFTTNENTIESFNIDGALGLEPLKIKRYTVLLTTSALSLAPAGVDTVEVDSCTTIDASSFPQIPVASFDPAGRFGGVAVGPYAGTNSFVRVSRGPDGRGPVTQMVNAYIEIEP